MSCTWGGRYPYLGTQAWRIIIDASSRFGSGIYPRLFVIAFAAATLAACGGPAVTSNKSEWRAVRRQMPDYDGRALPITVPIAKHVPSVKTKPEAKTSSYGIASFYKEDSETASGEKFDPHQLTAAHPTLPFGTRLRITNVATGRSVTVRINDRGPFVAGRTVDLSYSAAEAIGMIERGVTKVKLDVVR